MKKLNFVSEQLGMLGEHLKSVLITHLYLVIDIFSVSFPTSCLGNYTGKK